ncbi:MULTISPECIES: NADH:flavin oxidoreductase [Pelosinus]|jgi:2,4-dienoyl-CoA reductase-like NADH-dependent reductase (Old Yellow Enzyme family)|uniref:NADH:flavin oxidoreductase/NADH oxidase n=1 Tax=Pelosinus fermentans B4 TaxID=1149862 RepID=I9ARD0_9FIRM|nr:MULTISPECIES: NADH:flavin oxidoreductase [Pelosinus]EIW15507.1 NADH:flavin oxidoreductase/NADH oxidase [Pelosinus fermentans B4]EIW26802.1 NADH:flavin oxidoreductase/NADH oxidase [Pelosinus fermentans A11]
MSYVLKPLQAGSLVLANRLVMPPMATAKAEADGSVSQAVLDYYAEKTEGGYLPLVIIEHSFIHLAGKAGERQLSIADDKAIPGYKKLADAIHRNGAKGIVQINHAGSAADQEVTGKAPVGPSAIANPRKGTIIPHELTAQEIRELAADFQHAARRVKEAGFDGVEIHSAHGYLLNQFFSPLTNQRKDEYGGTVLKRIRIHLEVIAAVREVVGKDYPILLRLGASDFTAGGSTIEDSIAAVQEFEKAGVDILDISGGFCGYTIPDGSNEQGYFSPLTAAIKKVVSIPVILTGGITQAQAAEELLAEGKADLIGVGRAVLKDSNWAQQAVNSLL